MDLKPAGLGRMVIALGILIVLALSVHWTIEPGKYQTLTFILLGFFAFRIVHGCIRSR